MNHSQLEQLNTFISDGTKLIDNLINIVVEYFGDIVFIKNYIKYWMSDDENEYTIVTWFGKYTMGFIDTVQYGSNYIFIDPTILYVLSNSLESYCDSPDDIKQVLLTYTDEKSLKNGVYFIRCNTICSIYEELLSLKIHGGKEFNDVYSTFNVDNDMFFGKYNFDAYEYFKKKDTNNKNDHLFLYILDEIGEIYCVKKDYIDQLIQELKVLVDLIRE